MIGSVFLATLDETTMSAKVQLLMMNGTCTHASWSPDGKRVVFGWDFGNQNESKLYLADVDSGKEPHAIPGQDPSRRYANPDWSPDGKTIVCVSQPLDEVEDE